MANEVVGIDVVAKLDQFRSELAKIPEIGGDNAKALVSQLSREIKKAEQAATKAAQAARSAGSSLDTFGDKAGKLGSNAGKLAGALDLLVPGAGEAARSIADLADVGEVAATAGKGLGVSLGSILSIAGPVAVAVGALTLAWKYYSDQLAEAERKQKQSADILADVTTLTDKVTVAKRELAKALGGASAEEAVAAEVTEKWTKAGVESNKTLKEKQAELEAALATEQRYVNDGLLTHLAERDRLTEALKQNAREQARNMAIAEEGASVELEAKDAAQLRADAEKHVADQIAKKAKAAVDAAGKEKDAIEEASQAQERANQIRIAASDNILEQIGNTEALIAAVDKQGEAEDERIGRAFRDQDELLKKQIQVNKDLGLSTEALEKARVTLREQTRDKYAAMAEAETKKAQEEAEKQEQVAKDKRDSIVATFNDIVGQIGSIAAEIGSRFEDALAETESQIDELDSLIDGLGTTTVDASKLSGKALVQAYKRGEVAAEDLSASQKAAIEATLQAEKAALKKRAEEEKKAALVAFRIQQATSIVQTIIATAQGVMSAFQLGPVAGAIAAAAIAALGATQVALIASQKPKFHAGGLIGRRAGLAPDEVPMTARVGEAMLSGQGRRQIGDDNINRANAGRLGGSPASTTQVYKHKAFNYFIRDNLRLNGSLARTIRRGDRVGYVGRGRR